jgi:hypothetical protein
VKSLCASIGRYRARLRTPSLEHDGRTHPPVGQTPRMHTSASLANMAEQRRTWCTRLKRRFQLVQRHVGPDSRFVGCGQAVLEIRPILPQVGPKGASPSDIANGFEPYQNSAVVPVCSVICIGLLSASGLHIMKRVSSTYSQ